jgi:DNA modification methylase
LRDYKVAGQIGLEPTPEEYVSNLVEVFQEVWRVLRDDGVLFLNLGDSYATGAGKVGDCPGGGEQGERFKRHFGKPTPGSSPAMFDMTQPNRMPILGLKAKDLIGIPWRVAFALQADGWYLRSDIIWSKPNPMPESVTDRPTKSHEYIFLLTKSARYYWDQEAVKENATYTGSNAPDKIKSPYGQGLTRNASWKGSKFDGERDLLVHPNVGRKRGGNFSKRYADAQPAHGAMMMDRPEDNGKRNIRTVWTINTTPYKGSHFATFPPKLPETCILAASRPGDVVFDPFCGTGTVQMVARCFGRIGIGSDLAYQSLAAERIQGPLFAKVVNEEAL